MFPAEEKADTDAPVPAEAWAVDANQRALDELFEHARLFRTSRSCLELMRFVARFRWYSPFNAMLVHIQMPGAMFVAPAHRWQREFGRIVRANARPLVILQPRGPVMFVFDVSDTEPGPDARPLPPEVAMPYAVRRGDVGAEPELTRENAKRDGVLVLDQQAGSQQAGSIQVAKAGRWIPFLVSKRPEPVFAKSPLRYELLLNSSGSDAVKYATLTHELAHLYCGHLGTPNPDWWPDRRGLKKDAMEFEAESVSYLVCRRIGIETPADSCLAGYLRRSAEVPPISLDCVCKSAGLIASMGRAWLKPRSATKK